jgi:hypothetical protein
VAERWLSSDAGGQWEVRRVGDHLGGDRGGSWTLLSVVVRHSGEVETPGDRPGDCGERWWGAAARGATPSDTRTRTGEEGGGLRRCERLAD